MNSLLIKNGYLLDPANGIDQLGDLLVLDGMIAAVGEISPALYEGRSDIQTLDGRHCMVIPGLIDMSVSLREPGYKQKGSFQSELLAAVKGGVTALCSHPMSKPVNDTEAITRLILDKTSEREKAKVFPIAVATKKAEGKQLSEYQGLQKAGCVAVCHNLHTDVSTSVLRRSFQYASTHDCLVMIEPNDPGLTAEGCIHEGALASRLGLVGIPETAETIPLSRALLLAAETGVRLHVCQISSAKSVEMIREAKAQGIRVTCDVSINNLLLTENDIEDFNAQFHLRPPLRTSEDQRALLEGLATGAIDIIVSQHMPHEIAAKQAPFAEAESGASAIEILLPLAWRLVDEGRVTPGMVLKALTKTPASLIGIENYGLTVGSPADVCLFDPKASYTLEPAFFVSNGVNSPFTGQTIHGRVRHTLVNGVEAYSFVE